MGNYTFRTIDRDSDRRQQSVETYDPTGANYTTFATDVGALNIAIAAVSLGNVYEIVAGATFQDNPQVPPTGGFVQNDITWRVRFTDQVTGEKASFLIPCASLNSVPTTIDTETKRTLMDTGSTEYTDLKAALEVLARHNGNLITVNEVVYEKT